MDIKQIEYIVKIDDEHSITRAAEKLYLTQSALNQQLLRLERDLGTQLFVRSKSDWRPTPVGEVYLANAREILRIKRHTYNLISDMIETKKGRLSIGFTPGRGIEMFTKVYPDFHHAFPEITVEPRELSVRRQQALISRGDLDIGFQTLSEDQKTGDEYITLGREEILLAVPSVHPLAELAMKNAKEAALPDSTFPVVDISLFQYEPFVLMYRESTIRSLIDGLFRRSGFVPHILFETASNNTIVSMVQSRQCCGVIPYHYVKHQPEGITCFAFATHPTWDIVVSYQKNSYLSHAAKEFIRLAKEFWLTPTDARISAASERSTSASPPPRSPEQTQP